MTFTSLSFITYITYDTTIVMIYIHTDTSIGHIYWKKAIRVTYRNNYFFITMSLLS